MHSDNGQGFPLFFWRKRHLLSSCVPVDTATIPSVYIHMTFEWWYDACCRRSVVFCLLAMKALEQCRKVNAANNLTAEPIVNNASVVFSQGSFSQNAFFCHLGS